MAFLSIISCVLCANCSCSWNVQCNDEGCQGNLKVSADLTFSDLFHRFHFSPKSHRCWWLMRSYTPLSETLRNCTYTLERYERCIGTAAAGSMEWQVINSASQTCIHVCCIDMCWQRRRQRSSHILHHPTLLHPSGNSRHVCLFFSDHPEVWLTWSFLSDWGNCLVFR